MNKVTVNHGEIARLMGAIQDSVNQHQITIPMQADPAAAVPTVTHVTINGSNSGPIVTGNHSSASVGMSTAGTATAADPGRALTAEIVAEVLRVLPGLDLSDPDRELADGAGREILAEVETPKPDDSKIRNLGVRLKGLLAPLGLKMLTSAANAGADEAGKATHAALEALIHHTF